MAYISIFTYNKPFNHEIWKGPLYSQRGDTEIVIVAIIIETF